MKDKLNEEYKLRMKKKSNKESILKRADNVVNNRSEEKERMYGPFSEGMERAAKIASGMTGKDFEAVVSDGGAGGPTELVAIPERKRSEPSWRTECKLDDIVRHVRAWHLNLNS